MHPIILAVILFILEMKVTSFGLLSLGGIVALFLGSLMLFEGGAPGVRLPWQVLIPTVVMVSGFFIVIAGLGFRSQMSKPKTGGKGLIGDIGVAKTRLEPEGKVFVHGELWNAVADGTIESGAKVRVIGLDDLTLKVEEAT